MHYKNSAIAEMAAQYCTQVEFTLSIGDIIFSRLFLRIAENIYFLEYIFCKQSTVLTLTAVTELAQPNSVK